MENLVAANFRSCPVWTIIAAVALGIMPMWTMGISGFLGESRRFIVAMILKESVIMYSLGALLGICVSEIIRTIIIIGILALQVSMSFDDLLHGMVLGLIAGTMGAIYPAYKAARMAPVGALSFK
jgi:putative ABC transport system permease protein